MKVTISPENIRTMVPVTIEVSDIAKLPKVHVSPIGNLTVKKHHEKKQTYISEFYVQTPGQYQVSVSIDQQSFLKTLRIEQQQFLSFDREFGVFITLFCIVMLGVIVWTKKSMTKTGKE